MDGKRVVAVGLRSAPEYRYEKLSWESHMDKILSELTGSEYKYGFTTDIETEMIPKGLDEEVVRLISAKKGEPEWMLEYRLKAFRHWKTMTMPRWPHLDLPEIDFEDIIYYAAPKPKPKLNSLDEIDPEEKADDPVIFQSEDVVKNCEMFRYLGTDMEEYYNYMWKQLKAY